MGRIHTILLLLHLIPLALAVLPEGGSTEETAFLRAIHSHPDEDTPRLAYADWLDEHGQPKRAELIRLQVGIANRTIMDKNLMVRSVLLQREPEVLAHVPQALKQSGVFLLFERGFPEHLSIEAELFEKSGEAILASAPFVRRLDIHHGHIELNENRRAAGPLVDILARSSAAAQLRSLHFLRTNLTRRDLDRLIPKIPNVTSFGAHRSMSIELLQELLNLPFAEQLESIDINSCFKVAVAPPAEEALRAALQRLASRSTRVRKIHESLVPYLPPSLQRTIRSIEDPSRQNCKQFLSTFDD